MVKYSLKNNQMPSQKCWWNSKECNKLGEWNVDDHVIKSHMTLWVAAVHSKSPMDQVWCWQVLWTWRYDFFILSRDITWPHDQKNMLLDKWEQLHQSYSIPSSVLMDLVEVGWNISNFSRDVNRPRDQESYYSMGGRLST